MAVLKPAANRSTPAMPVYELANPDITGGKIALDCFAGKS
jgi:hypothetical protein